MTADTPSVPCRRRSAARSSRSVFHLRAIQQRQIKPAAVFLAEIIGRHHSCAPASRCIELARSTEADDDIGAARRCWRSRRSAARRSSQRKIVGLRRGYRSFAVNFLVLESQYVWSGSTNLAGRTTFSVAPFSICHSGSLTLEFDRDVGTIGDWGRRRGGLRPRTDDRHAGAERGGAEDRSRDGLVRSLLSPWTNQAFSRFAGAGIEQVHQRRVGGYADGIARAGDSAAHGTRR